MSLLLFSIRFWGIDCPLCLLSKTDRLFSERGGTQVLSDGILHRTRTSTRQAFLSRSSFTSLQVCKETANQRVIRHAELPGARYGFPGTVARHHPRAAGTFMITRRRMTRVVTLRSSSELESLSLFLKS